jgi:hypothetical protein
VNDRFVEVDIDMKKKSPERKIRKLPPTKETP